MPPFGPWPGGPAGGGAGDISLRTPTTDLTVINQVPLLISPGGAFGRMLAMQAWIVVDSFTSGVDATGTMIFHAGDGSGAESQSSLITSTTWALVDINAAIDNDETPVIGLKPAVANFPRSLCNLSSNPRLFITQGASGPVGFTLTGHLVIAGVIQA